MIRTDFCVFILTHGRADNVVTYETLKRASYSGKVYLVVDDEDVDLPEYRKRYGNEVLVFSKARIEEQFDTGDNFEGRRGVVYARNACFDLAKSVGCKYFLQLDDDYTSFYLRFNSRLEYGNTSIIRSRIDEIFDAMLSFFIESGALTVAMSQGGDHIGGSSSPSASPGPRLFRKAMNSFFCSTERRFDFVGRINEDVTTYVERGRRGGLFLTVYQAQLNQLTTQSNPGGLTDIYLDAGTYVKSFYSVMYAPSCVRVGELGDGRNPHYRIHHDIDWRYAVPVILREEIRKPDGRRKAAPQGTKASSATSHAASRRPAGTGRRALSAMRVDSQ